MARADRFIPLPLPASEQRVLVALADTIPEDQLEAEIPRFCADIFELFGEAESDANFRARHLTVLAAMIARNLYNVMGVPRDRFDIL